MEINNFRDLKKYLNEDRVALKRNGNYIWIMVDPIWRFQFFLRVLEYLHNTKKSIAAKILKVYFRILSKNLGFTIPLNCFGPGLSIAHYGTIVVNEKAKIGSNCRLHVCVIIGGGKNSAPCIGNNVYIGPGAKIYGDIEIGNNIKIGANSVVNKSFLENNLLIAGSPAKIIKDFSC